jgi:hypothetical protein
LIAVIRAEDDSPAHLLADPALARRLQNDLLANADRKNGADEIASHPVVRPVH